MQEQSEQLQRQSSDNEDPFRRDLLEEDDGPGDLTWYFDQCEKNRDLLHDIYVVIPMRPSDGMNALLHRMVSIWYGEGTGYADLQDAMGGFIEHTRANIALNFLKNPPLRPDGKPCKYLLMIDNDMEPVINLPYMLARHDLPVVGVCAMAIDKKWGPQLCFSLKDREGNYRFPCLQSGQAIPKTGVVEVGHCGTGAMLIRRDVLEQFDFGEYANGLVERMNESLKTNGEAKQFTAQEVKAMLNPDIPFYVSAEHKLFGMGRGIIKTGEDIAFCNQLRAKGIPIHVDLEAHIGHRKPIAMQWDDNMRDPFLDAKKWVLPMAGKIIESR